MSLIFGNIQQGGEGNYFYPFTFTGGTTSYRSVGWHGMTFAVSGNSTFQSFDLTASEAGTCDFRLIQYDAEFTETGSGSTWYFDGGLPYTGNTLISRTLTVDAGVNKIFINQSLYGTSSVPTYYWIGFESIDIGTTDDEGLLRAYDTPDKPYAIFNNVQLKDSRSGNSNFNYDKESAILGNLYYYFFNSKFITGATPTTTTTTQPPPASWETYNLSMGELNNTYGAVQPTWQNVGIDEETTPLIILDNKGDDNGITLMIPEDTESMNVRKDIFWANTSISSVPDFHDDVLERGVDSYGKFITDSQNAILRLSGFSDTHAYNFKIMSTVDLGETGWATEDADYTGIILSGATSMTGNSNPIDNHYDVFDLRVKPNNGVIDLNFMGDEDWDHPLINAFIIKKSGDFPTSGLTSYWRMNETSGTTVYDSVGSIDGTLSGVVRAQGFYDNGILSTSSTERCIKCGDEYNYDRDDKFSVSGWIKSTNNGIASLASKYDSGNFKGWNVMINPNTKNSASSVRIEFLSNNSEGNFIWATNSNIGYNDGEWHLYTFTYNGSSLMSGMKFYRDGVEQTLTLAGGDNLLGSMVTSFKVEFCIGGKSNNAVNSSIVGNLDEVGMWDRVLSEDEIIQLCANGAGAVYTVFDDLTSYWKFDETSGTVAYDSVGSFDGTFTDGSFTSAGKNNNAYLNSDYSSQSVVLGDVYNFERTDSWSVGGWVYNDNLAANRLPLFTKMGGSSAQSYRGHQFRIQAGGYVYCLLENTYPTNGIYVKATTTQMVDDTWYYISMSYDGSSNASGVKMYVNGILQTQTVQQDNLSATIVPSSSIDCCIGSVEQGVVGMEGKIDEVAVWDRVLTPSEMLELYNSGSGKFYTT